ncbi:MAG: HAMP domain-containing histidine kinase [Actinomycetota bacterium]|nr:HAMP domain-containing histidine kinase [Actinomycetota bacterium]
MTDHAVSPVTPGSRLSHFGERVRRTLPRGQTLPDDVWRRRHRAMLTILWLHAPGLTIFGVLQGFGVEHSVLEGGIVAGIAVIASLPFKRRKVPSGLVSLGLLTCSAILVHMSGGFIEAHFHFFVMVVLLSLYEDWTPFLLAVAYVVVHHGLVGVLDPRSVYNHPNAIAEPWRWAAVHGLFIAGAGLASIAAWKLNEEFRTKFRDVAEEAEAANRKLEETNQTLKDFVAIASHDLRGPLSTILGFVTAMPRTWDSTSDDEKRQFIGAIERAARRIGRLVDDLLTVSRIESGQVAVHKQAVDLQRAVQDALGRTADLGNGVETRVPPACVDADPDHVERILANYVTNAVKYGERPVEVEARENNGWVEIRVRDHGSGIPEDFIPRMWEKFARPNDPTDREKGTGLGLSIVAGLARANGGTAWYEPNEPRGSCFCLRLPRANRSPTEPSHAG